MVWMRWFKRILGIRDFKRRYETKYAAVDTIRYEGRVLPDGRKLSIDVRNFFVNPLTAELVDKAGWLRDLCGDQRAFQVDRYVQKVVRYVSDKSQFGLPEFWMLPFETMNTWAGDCDDGAILEANMLLAAGVDPWKIRLTAGEVHTGEGHCWLTYFCEETRRWVALDWCFQPSLAPIAKRLDYKDTGLYKRVWFSWTPETAFFGEAAVWSAGGGKSGYTFKYGSAEVIVPAKPARAGGSLRCE